MCLSVGGGGFLLRCGKEVKEGAKGVEKHVKKKTVYMSKMNNDIVFACV